jgi:hypothetical protein
VVVGGGHLHRGHRLLTSGRRLPLLFRPPTVARTGAPHRRWGTAATQGRRASRRWPGVTSAGEKVWGEQTRGGDRCVDRFGLTQGVHVHFPSYRAQEVDIVKVVDVGFKKKKGCGCKYACTNLDVLVAVG